MKLLKQTATIALVCFSFVTLAAAQTSSPSSAVAGATNAARTDIYHVHVAHATLGKAADLGESFKKPGPSGPQPDHQVIFRHQYGDSWDYVVVGHYGTKITIEAARQQIP